jgi:hypothetical protein
VDIQTKGKTYRPKLACETILVGKYNSLTSKFRISVHPRGKTQRKKKGKTKDPPAKNIEVLINEMQHIFSVEKIIENYKRRAEINKIKTQPDPEFSFSMTAAMLSRAFASVFPYSCHDNRFIDTPTLPAWLPR